MKDKIGGVIEGLILLVLGCYMGFLVFSGNYWYYLNPKFMWLTAATGFMLIITGTAALLNPKQRLSLWRIFIFLIFILILGVGTYSGIPYATQNLSKTEAKRTFDEKPRAILNGTEYIRINLAELFMLCEDNAQEKILNHYVTRGIVYRSEQLDHESQFGLVRNAVWCCLADSVGIGLRVQSDRFDNLSEGQWVEVYGTLSRLSEQLPDAGLRPNGMRLIALSSSCKMIADRVVGIEEPEIPFIFEFRDAEPYAY